MTSPRFHGSSVPKFQGFSNSTVEHWNDGTMELPLNGG